MSEGCSDGVFVFTFCGNLKRIRLLAWKPHLPNQRIATMASPAYKDTPVNCLPKVGTKTPHSTAAINATTTAMILVDSDVRNSNNPISPRIKTTIPESSLRLAAINFKSPSGGGCGRKAENRYIVPSIWNAGPVAPEMPSETHFINSSCVRFGVGTQSKSIFESHWNSSVHGPESFNKTNLPHRFASQIDNQSIVVVTAGLE